MTIVTPEEVLLTTASAQESPTVIMQESVVVATGTVGAAVDEATTGGEEGNSNHPKEEFVTSPAAIEITPEAGDQKRQQEVGTPQLSSPQMKAPHISTLYDKQDVMVKHFGVTPEQALRTQALLRLGVTEEDVRTAERLMGSRSEAENEPTKEEWLLGVTYAQMSFHKALQVLGISEAVVEEERSRRLGELGSGGCRGTSEGSGGQDGEDMCGGFFAKKRRSSSQELGITLPGEVAFAQTHTRVLELEEVCHTQMSRIQELENQLAELSARPSPSVP